MSIDPTCIFMSNDDKAVWIWKALELNEALSHCLGGMLTLITNGLQVLRN